MPRRFVSKLWFAPLLLIFWNLGYAPFWNPDEGRYATASLEMASPLNGGPSDWLVPHLNTAVRLNKPPLVYWAGAGSFKLFGASEATGRLPNALAAFLVAVVLFYWGKRAFDRRSGQVAALVWITMGLPFVMGRILNTDMLLAFAITLATYGVWGALRHNEDQEDQDPTVKLTVPWGDAVTAGVGMGLALLSKGPVGLALPLAVAFLYLCLAKGWRRAPWTALLAALAIAFCIGAPWYLAVQAQRPDFLHTFIFEENLGRFSGSQQYHNKTSKLYYLPVMLLGMLPWTGFLGAALGKWTRHEADGRVRLFALVWAGFIVVFFSLSGTKLPSYVLPAFPPLALVIGASLARWEGAGKAPRSLALGATVFLNILLMVTGGAFLLKDKTLPPDAVKPAMITLAVALALATVALLLVARRGQGKPIVVVQVLAASTLFVVLNLFSRQVSPYVDSSPFFMDLGTRLQPGDRVIGFNTFVPTATYYCKRPIYYLGFSNTSGLNPEELKQSEYFPGFGQTFATDPAYQARMLKLLMSGRRAWVWSKGRINDDVEKQLHFWGRNNDSFYYSNQPKPAGYVFDKVAPGKRYKEDRPTHVEIPASQRRP